ncbi:glycosyltransferase family 2 protein [Pectinatus frisingensis]|uniref:glycosyltransferase family 2 protein n=1 Tax=Pectinatus frisingensis TaxID=865 RepID=UPI0018C48A18|nr:glycosyltransferase family 2 protein [Pectinatus frisingensis]
MIRISACVIVKNEEKNIRHYLKNMRAIADEIIVVDTGSTDDTCDVAVKAGAVLYKFKWCNDFSAARNFAIGKARGKWILFLDADEYFTDESIKLVKKNIMSIEKDVKIFMCRLTNIDERRKPVNTVYVVRGLRNDPQLRYQGRVHEQLFYAGKEITNIAVISDIEIYHTGYWQKDVEDKLRRNLKIMNDDMAENGDNPRYYSALADCYYGLGDYDRAITFAEKFIASGLKALGGEEQIYHTLISAMYLSGKSSDEILFVLGRYGKKDQYKKIIQKKYNESAQQKENIFISACVIMKNEEKNIQRYLKYIRPLVNEIIFVDTGSTDNTIDIAQRAGAKVYNFKWCDDFAAAKNFAIEKARGRWIIFLDADEYFPENDGRQVLKYIKKYDSDPKVDALACKMTNIDPDNDEFLSSFYQLRVFRNDPDMRYLGKIHESLQGRNNKIIQLKVLQDDVQIMHTGYSASNSKEKSKRNLVLLKNEVEKNGDDPQYFAYMGDCYYGLGDYEKAIYYSRKFIDSGLNMIGAEINPYVRLIDSLFLAGHANVEILKAVDAAIDKFKTVPDFFVMKSFLLLKECNYIDSEKNLQKTIALLKTKNFNITSSVMPRFENFIYNVAGALAKTRDDKSKAISYFIKSLQNDKHNVEFFDNFYYVVKNKDNRLLLRMLNKIYNFNDDTDINFLTAMLKRYRLDEKFLYCFNMLSKKDMQNPFREYALIAQKKYRMANEILIVDLQEIYKKMIFEFLLDKKQDKYEKMQLILPDAYKAILDKAIRKFNRM